MFDFIYGKRYKELKEERHKKAYRKGYWEGAWWMLIMPLLGMFLGCAGVIALYMLVEGLW